MEIRNLFLINIIYVRELLYEVNIVKSLKKVRFKGIMINNVFKVIMGFCEIGGF